MFYLMILVFATSMFSLPYRNRTLITWFDAFGSYIQIILLIWKTEHG